MPTRSRLGHYPCLFLFGLMSCGLLSACRAGDPPWILEKTSPRTDLGHGALHVTKSVTGRTKVALDLVFFDERQCGLRVVANPTREGARPISQVATEPGVIAVCNGGYFHAQGDFGPTGLEIASGIRSGAVEPVNPLGGALVVRQGTAALVWDDEFHDGPEVTQYVHCSPWLVSDGRIWQQPVAGTDDIRAQRTFILTDGRGRWAIGTSNGIGLVELAQLLITPGIISEMAVKRALNLDGGPSSAMWWRDTAGGEHGSKPGWAVRNFVVVVPRSGDQPGARPLTDRLKP